MVLIRELKFAAIGVGSPPAAHLNHARGHDFGESRTGRSRRPALVCRALLSAAWSQKPTVAVAKCGQVPIRPYHTDPACLDAQSITAKNWITGHETLDSPVSTTRHDKCLAARCILSAESAASPSDNVFEQDTRSLHMKVQWAPCSRSSLATLVLPSRSAICNGCSPDGPTRLTSAPNSIKNRTRPSL